MFWGLSPALDLIQLYKDETNVLPDTLNILLVGGADARHILKTLARRYRHNCTLKLNFFICEASVETIAKQLLLLNIAFQREMGLIQKTRFFMELYGNSLVRPSSAKFLSTTSRHLLKLITNYECLKKNMPFVIMELKYKERDYLENLLKFWCGSEEFNICECWDRRVRKFLGPRYDAKLGAFDWDLHMRLHSIGGQQVCNQEYRNFRQSGVAFSWIESEVSQTNRSLVCGVLPIGETLAHFGYLGDIQTGPFIAYGLECEDTKFLESTHGQNTHRSTDVTERNLHQIFHEIQFQEDYHHNPISDMKLGYVTMKEPEKRVVEFRGLTKTSQTLQNECIDLDGVEIKFVSVSLLEVMKYREEFDRKFNLIYFGHSYLKHASGELLGRIAALGALVLIENQKFVLNYREQQLREHHEGMKQIGLRAKEFDCCVDNFAVFINDAENK